MKTAVFNRVEYSILMRTETGLKYGIQTRQNVSGYSPEEYPNIGIRQAGGWWYIDHIPTGLKVSTFGCKSRKAALESYIQDYHSKVNEVETKRQDFLKKAVETFQKSPLEEEAAAWETVNYCTVRNHRFDKVTEAARRAGLIIRNADKITYQDGGNVNISGPSEKLEAVKAIIAEYEKRDLARAAEEAAAKEAAERPETISESEAEPEAVQDAAPEAEENTFVMKEICFDLRNGGKNEKRVIYSQTGDRLAELPEAREAVQQDAAPAEPEATAERPETISEDLPALAPVVALLAPVPAPAADADRKAAPRRQAPPKPARGPGKPLDFSGQTIAGDGWQIVFDAALQRTRVIIQESDRAKLAPLAEAAGFYYSVNTDSWHKKLTHKAHRAALALADAFRAAVAAA